MARGAETQLTPEKRRTEAASRLRRLPGTRWLGPAASPPRTRTRTGHELCPGAKNPKPDACKGRRRAPSRSPAKTIQGPSAPCHRPRRCEDAWPGPPLAQERRVLSSEEADSGSLGRHRVACCSPPSSAPQRRPAKQPLPRQPTRQPHYGPPLRSRPPHRLPGAVVCGALTGGGAGISQEALRLTQDAPGLGAGQQLS